MVCGLVGSEHSLSAVESERQGSDRVQVAHTRVVHERVEQRIGSQRAEDDFFRDVSSRADVLEFRLSPWIEHDGVSPPRRSCRFLDPFLLTVSLPLSGDGPREHDEGRSVIGGQHELSGSTDEGCAFDAVLCGQCYEAGLCTVVKGEV